LNYNARNFQNDKNQVRVIPKNAEKSIHIENQTTQQSFWERWNYEKTLDFYKQENLKHVWTVIQSNVEPKTKTMLKKYMEMLDQDAQRLFFSEDINHLEICIENKTIAIENIRVRFNIEIGFDEEDLAKYKNRFLIHSHVLWSYKAEEHTKYLDRAIMNWFLDNTLLNSVFVPPYNEEEALIKNIEKAEEYMCKYQNMTYDELWDKLEQRKSQPKKEKNKHNTKARNSNFAKNKPA
jgi:hypothetical protein